MAALSSETLHATTVAINGRAVMIGGPSGVGKSDLALRLVDRGAQLVSDDYTMTRRIGERLLASPPVTIEGKIEVRGIGIVDMDFVRDIPVALMIELHDTVDRMPLPPMTRMIAGVAIPLMKLVPREASTPVKLEYMLRLFGLKVAP